MSSSPDAQACGPCTTPELWDVQNLEGEPVVVTNFGLLSRDADGWRLTCEEAIGGLLLDAQGDAAESFVSTDSGLFQQSGGVCDWSSGPASVGNDWALSFSLSRVDEGEAPARYALVIDAETQELHVERSVPGQDFEVIHSFDRTSGYRELESAGDPAALFVAGYTNEPTQWNLAYSVDDGETWEETAPEEVDNAYSTLHLRLVDPAFPHAVFAQAETVAGLGHQIWRFDADSGAIEKILSLQDGEVFGGIALSGDTLWVAGRHRGGGSLYRADHATLEFSRVVDEGPPFECLAAHDGMLYACINDFTYASEFLLGGSTDDGATWTPLMTIGDLGTIAGCDDGCSVTVEWLRGSYGITDGADAGAAGAGGGTAGGASPDEPNGKGDSGGGCTLVPQRLELAGSPGALAALFGLVSLLWVRRRRSPAE